MSFRERKGEPSSTEFTVKVTAAGFDFEFEWVGPADMLPHALHQAMESYEEQRPELFPDPQYDEWEKS